MSERLRRPPEKRSEQFNHLLHGRKKVEGFLPEGQCYIGQLGSNFWINIPSGLPNVRLVLNLEDGELVMSQGYYDNESGGGEPRPLSEFEQGFVQAKLAQAEELIDETLASFRESEITEAEEQEVIEESAEEIIEAARDKVISLSVVRQRLQESEADLNAINALGPEGVERIRHRAQQLLDQNSNNQEAA